MTAQKRLGAAIVSRRVHLGMKTREQLAAKIDLSYRSLSDLENGRRSFSVNTHALMERALEWEPGTIARILASDEPVALTNDEDIRQRIGAQARRLRAERGMDRSALVRAAGVDPKTIRTFEQGLRWPQDGSLYKIERALGVPNGTFTFWRAEPRVMQARLSGVGHAQTKPPQRVVNRHPRLAANSSRHVPETNGGRPAGYIAAHIIPGEEPSEIPFIIWNNLVASSAKQAERFRADAERGESEGPWRVYALIDVTDEMPADDLQGGAA